MSKAVLISVQPRWCELIARCQKTIEVRKTRPKLETPFRCYIYQTRRKWLYKLLEKLSSFEWARAIIEGQGKVIGEFVCDTVCSIHISESGYCVDDLQRWPLYESQLTFEEMAAYIGYGKVGYGWHISNLKIYDTPKELFEFRAEGECKGGPRCNICPYFERGNGYNLEDDCNFVGNTEYKPILKAPQSWCYVEDNAHETV